MAGYAAFGSVVRGQLTTPVAAWPSAPEVGDPRFEPGTALIEEAEERPRPSVRGRLRDRLATAREQWSITTFYLFDPNSWR